MQCLKEKKRGITSKRPLEVEGHDPHFGERCRSMMYPNIGPLYSRCHPGEASKKNVAQSPFFDLIHHCGNYEIEIADAGSFAITSKTSKTHLEDKTRQDKTRQNLVAQCPIGSTTLGARARVFTISVFDDNET